MERYSSSEISGENSFEEQFKNLQEVRLPSGTAEVGDFTPEKLKDEVPILLAQAWGLGLETYKPAMERLFDDERRVVSIAHPRVGGSLKSSMNVPELTVDPKRSLDKKFFDKYPEAELRKALNTLEVLEELNIEKVDAIAHSEGAMNIAIAAAMYPEKFRSIIFFGPAGMLDKESWPRIAKGFAAQGTRPEAIKDIPITESERAVGAAAAKDLKKYLDENPERALSEVAAMVNRSTQTKDLLPYLRALGINIAVISASSDPVFPPAEVEKATKAAGVTFLSVRGGHGMIGDHPEIVMPVVEEQLEEFATQEKTPEQEKMLAERKYHAGVRYIPGEGLKISEYIKRGE